MVEPHGTLQSELFRVLASLAWFFYPPPPLKNVHMAAAMNTSRGFLGSTEVSNCGPPSCHLTYPTSYFDTVLRGTPGRPRRMPTPPVLDIPSESLTLDTLSSELLVLIFEQLADIGIGALCSVRATCRRFNAIATPVHYRNVVLEEGMMDRDSCPSALRHMREFTKHLIIPSDLNSEEISGAVSLMRNLQTINWRCVLMTDTHRLALPHHVLEPGELRRRRIRLRIQELPVQSLRSVYLTQSLQGLPTDLVESLTMKRPIAPMANRMDALKQILLRSTQLRHFEYHDRGQGIQFDLQPGERLPALRSLVLRHYDWQHTAGHWDLSHLRRLELYSVPLYPFLSAISFSDLRNLHTLVAEDFSAHLSTDHRAQHTRALHHLIRDSIAPNSLRKLETTVHVSLFPIDAILRHAKSLEHLCLHDHVGLEDETRACPTLRIADVQTLSRRLTSLRHLEIDMDAASVAFDASAGSTATIPNTRRRLFLDAVAAFPRVHTLTLHVQTLVRPHAPTDPRREDRDYDAATTIFEMLRHARERLRGPAWRKITVNVGGWRPIMVRRLGQAWRRQNERGVFAERCFVIERAGDGDGGERPGAYIVREERGELRSRAVGSDEDSDGDDEKDEEEDPDGGDNDYDNGDHGRIDYADNDAEMED